jgi:hypothetical protein
MSTGTPLGDRKDLVALLDRVVGRDHPGVVAARCLSRLDLAELGALPVRPGPVARDGERALARFGLLGEGAAAAFARARDTRWPGRCLAGTGLLACARTVYGRLRNGFYGLETMPVMLVFCARLNDTQTRYPGTTLTLRYEVKEHPGTALVCLPMSGALNTGYLRGSRNSRHAGVGLELGLRCLRSSSRRSR